MWESGWGFHGYLHGRLPHQANLCDLLPMSILSRQHEAVSASQEAADLQRMVTLTVCSVLPPPPQPPPAVTAPAPWPQPWPEPQLTASCRPTSPSTTSIRLQKTELTRYHVSPRGSYGASLTLTQIRSLTHSHSHHPTHTHTCRRVTTRDLTQFLRLKKIKNV